MQTTPSTGEASGPVHGGRVDRYTKVAIALHWVIAALFAVNFLTGFFRESFGTGLVRTIMGIHKPTGLLILAFTLVRIAWRVGHRPPPAPPGPKWQTAAAGGVHMLLYLLMLALPLSGWAMTSAAHVVRPLSFYGWFPLPFLPLPRSAALDGVFNTAHFYLGLIALCAIAFHVAAALKHQFIDRDDLMQRMTP